MHHLFVIGTRPEVIKCAPVIHQLRAKKETVSILLTGQHADLVQPLLSFFNLTVTDHLQITHTGDHQKLLDTVQEKMKPLLKGHPADIVWVQGDTTTALAGGLAAKDAGKQLAHIEAGLRSYQREPFPEEENRTRLGQLANYHFCPTDSQAENLKKEGIQGGLWVTGNTVIDALLWTQKKVIEMSSPPIKQLPKQFILMTCHRSEWKNQRFTALCQQLKGLFEAHPEHHLVFPVHPTPEIHEVAHATLGGVENVHLLPPCDYPSFVQLMVSCKFILTDSGGIQEEAPSLNKPVFVLREATERPEVITSGSAEKWGTDPNIIAQNLCRLLKDPRPLRDMIGKINPFGTGDAAKKIVSGIIETYDTA